MITETERKRIIDLIHQEVVPAIGCTEPIAVALCVAKATETLGTKPEKINVLLSANILKNAMGVGIPGTGMIGLPIAIALGALAWWFGITYFVNKVRTQFNLRGIWILNRIIGGIAIVSVAFSTSLVDAEVVGAAASAGADSSFTFAGSFAGAGAVLSCGLVGNQ